MSIERMVLIDESLKDRDFSKSSFRARIKTSDVFSMIDSLTTLKINFSSENVEMLMIFERLKSD